MDTDDLTPMAYAVLVMARAACDPLCPEIGVMAKNFRSEDDYLAGIHAFLRKVLRDPDGYLGGWNMQDQMDPKKLARDVRRILKHVQTTMDTPLPQRRMRR